MFSFERDNDTICAIATAPGSGGIAVLRLSGERALSLARQLCRFLPEKPESHRIYYGFLTKLNPPGENASEKLDEVLVSYFEKGRSFTGEETIEVSCHGGRFLCSLILKELVSAGARVAQPGEFTYRAFMNQRLDLVQAEAVLELINSENSAASQLALRQLEGGFSTELKDIKNELTTGLAHLEANIDFASEDIEIASNSDLQKKLKEVRNRLQELLGQYKIGRIAREGLSLLLVGEPNVGKSSLLNVLVREEKAIVTDVPGTTRDLIEGMVEISGLPVRITDTAGFRETLDPVERIGIDRMKGRLKNADYVLVLIDGTDRDGQTLKLVSEFVPKEKTLIAFNKADLVPARTEAENMDWLQRLLTDEVFESLRKSGRIFTLSAKSGLGVHDIREFLATEISKMSEVRSSGLMNARHFELIQNALRYLEKGLELLNKNESPDFIAFELHASLRAIYGILGERFDDQVMDQVFREFCLGK